MIVTSYANEITHNAALFDQIYALRAKAFNDRRKWSVKVTNGRERDHFDDLNPLYVCVTNRGGQLQGSLRLLPTHGAHMLADVFSDVMGGEEIIRHPLIWESSRFCVDTDLVTSHGHDGVNRVTHELLIGLFESAEALKLKNIVSVYDLFLERILRRAGCTFERIGQVAEYDGLKTTAGLFEVSAQATAKLIAKASRLEEQQIPAQSQAA